MTELEKCEVANLVQDAVSRAMETNHRCPLGLDPGTARELISFAETWKSCRRLMIGGVVTTAAGGLLIALWSGVKATLSR